LPAPPVKSRFVAIHSRHNDISCFRTGYDGIAVCSDLPAACLKTMASGASSWISKDFQIDTSLAFQGNFSIAKAQRAVLGSSRLRSLVYPAFVLSAKSCAS
jgi:hypothetical protein